MQSTYKEISKQINKIIRILTKVSEQYPKVSKEIDLALYASIKIQKIINKYLENQSSNRQAFKPKVNEYQITKNSDSDDAFFTTAMQTIQNFKKSTFKLQRKINVLINEQDYQIKKAITNQSVYPITTQSLPKNGHQVQVKQQRKRKNKREMQAGQQSQQSRNLRSLDESIIKIVNDIKLMQGIDVSSNQDQQ